MAPTRIPGIEYAAMPRAGTKASALAWPPRLVVVHDTGNSQSTRYAEASFAANRTDPSSNWTSAHGYVDRGGVLGSLPLNLQAWAAFSYANSHGFHVEICLRDLHDPDAMQWAAWFVMRLCQEAGIPMRKLTPAQVAAGERGVCGHYDITVGLGVGDHTDPSWSAGEWADFMARVNGGDDMALTDTVPGSGSSGTGGRDRTVGQILGDLANLRAVLIGEKTAAQAGYGGSTPLAQLLTLAAAGPAKPLEATALAAALAALLADHLDIQVSADTLLGVLTSDAGQAALVAAANKAEDS